MKQIFCVDVDDVLANFGKNRIIFLNKEYGLDLTIESFTSFNYRTIFECSKEEVKRRLNRYSELHLDNLNPEEGAEEGVRILKDKFDLKVLTSRPIHLEERTRRWVNKVFPNSFSEVFFTSSHTPMWSKEEICNSINAWGIVDDYVGNLFGCERRKAFLFGDWPYSRFETNRFSREKYYFVERAKNWKILTEKLMS